MLGNSGKFALENLTVCLPAVAGAERRHKCAEAVPQTQARMTAYCSARLLPGLRTRMKGGQQACVKQRSA
jgi:hypothetical protein